MYENDRGTKMSNTSFSMISLMFTVFGILILYVGVHGIPIFYDSLDFNQKLCNQSHTCTKDLEVREDQIQNGLIWFYIIAVPSIGIFMVYLGIAGFKNLPTPFDRKESKSQ